MRGESRTARSPCQMAACSLSLRGRFTSHKPACVCRCGVTCLQACCSVVSLCLFAQLGSASATGVAAVNVSDGSTIQFQLASTIAQGTAKLMIDSTSQGSLLAGGTLQLVRVARLRLKKFAQVTHGCACRTAICSSAATGSCRKLRLRTTRAAPSPSSAACNPALAQTLMCAALLSAFDVLAERTSRQTCFLRCLLQIATGGALVIDSTSSNGGVYVSGHCSHLLLVLKSCVSCRLLAFDRRWPEHAYNSQRRHAGCADIRFRAVKRL